MPKKKEQIYYKLIKYTDLSNYKLGYNKFTDYIEIVRYINSVDKDSLCHILLKITLPKPFCSNGAIKVNEFIINSIIDLVQNGELLIYYIKKFGILIQFLKNQTPELCKIALSRNYNCFKYIKYTTPDILEHAIRSGVDISNISSEYYTYELCKVAAQYNYEILNRIKDEYKTP